MSTCADKTHSLCIIYGKKCLKYGLKISTNLFYKVDCLNFCIIYGKNIWNMGLKYFKHSSSHHADNPKVIAFLSIILVIKERES